MWRNTTRSRASPSSRPSSKPKLRKSSATEPSGPGETGDKGKDERHSSSFDKKRFSDRPGSPLVPRLRRLRDFVGGTGGLPRTGNSPREVRRYFWNRLLEPFSLLHEYVRVPHHSWPRAGGRHGN